MTLQTSPAEIVIDHVRRYPGQEREGSATSGDLVLEVIVQHRQEKGVMAHLIIA